MLCENESPNRFWFPCGWREPSARMQDGNRAPCRGGRDEPSWRLQTSRKVTEIWWEKYPWHNARGWNWKEMTSLGKDWEVEKNYSVFRVIQEWFAEVWLMALWTDVIWSSLQACKETFPPLPEIGTAKSLRKFLITEDLFKILHFHPQSEPLQWFTASCGVWGTSEVRYWIK